MKKVLVVVDMQADFVTGALGSPAAQAVVEPIRERIAFFRAQGWPVVYTMDTHPQREYDDAKSQESTRIPPHCVQGGAGWAVVDALAPAPGEKVVEKPSFMSLTLEQAIGPLEPGDAIELCGVCTDICVVSNALRLRACYPDNPVEVHSGLCAGTSEEKHRAALGVMGSCLIDVIS